MSELLTALGCDGEEAVKAADGGETSLRPRSPSSTTSPSRRAISSARGSRTVARRSVRCWIRPAEELKKWLWGREIIDVLLDAERQLRADGVRGLLQKLQPRLYSISSSPNAHPGEVHATVGSVRYETHGGIAKACAPRSSRIAAAETPMPVFIQMSHGFRLPENGDRPIIMVGPGTGIAPFRAFLEERIATGAKGRNWLFFGDQRRATDFLYRRNSRRAGGGHLSRLDLAFSRDQAEKIYVQQRMLEAAAELWRGWKRARISTCAETPAGWPRTWTPPCTRYRRSWRPQLRGGAANVARS